MNLYIFSFFFFFFFKESMFLKLFTNEETVIYLLIENLKKLTNVIT